MNMEARSRSAVTDPEEDGIKLVVCGVRAGAG